MSSSASKPELITSCEEGLLNKTYIPGYMHNSRRFRIEYRDPSSGFSNFEGVVYLSSDDPLIYERVDAICEIIAKSFNVRSF